MIWLKMPLFMFLRDLNITFLNQIKIFKKKIHVCFMSKQNNKCYESGYTNHRNGDIWLCYPLQCNMDRADII